MEPMVALAGAMNSSAAQALAQAAQDASLRPTWIHHPSQALGLINRPRPWSNPQKKSWVEIELVDDKGKPVPFEEARLQLADDRPREAS
jgi:hypothetical protein